MLRITEHMENNRTVRLRLDGTISLQSFDDLKEACNRHLEETERMIILDMEGVDFMSDDAASRVALLQSESLRVINCSPFITTLLETVGRMNWTL